MLLAYSFGAIVMGVIGVVQGFKYSQTPNKTHFALSLVFLILSGCLVYLAMTTSA